jgi:hypothetical protein
VGGHRLGIEAAHSAPAGAAVHGGGAAEILPAAHPASGVVDGYRRRNPLWEGTVGDELGSPEEDRRNR